MNAQGFLSTSDQLKSYLDVGIDPNKAVEAALQVPISMHCWQADDVAGLESGGSAADSGGIKSTGNYPGKARNGDEMRMDFEKVLSLVPGVHRVNIHAFYAEPGKKKVDRDAMDLSHFQNWMDWAKSRKIALDFNPTYFAHSKAADGFTLSSADEGVREFWVKHGIASRKIAGADGKFLPAKAEILPEGSIKVFSPGMTLPSAVRYAWFNWGEVSLYNSDNLPAEPFQVKL